MSGKSQTIGDFSVPDRPGFCPYVAKIADHRTGRVGKIETLPICPGLSPMIGGSCFHKSAKSRTVGKEQNPRSSRIFPAYENQV